MSAGMESHWQLAYIFLMEHGTSSKHLIGICRWIHPVHPAWRFLWSPGSSTMLMDSHSTITAEPPLMVYICSNLWHSTWCWAEVKGVSRGLLVGIGGDEAAVVGCLRPTPPFVFAKNQYHLDRYVLVLILEISTISKWHLAQVQTLYLHCKCSTIITCIWDLPHFFLIPLVPQESSKTCWGLFSLTEALCLHQDQPSDPKENQSQQLSAFFRKWFSFLWNVCLCCILILWDL